MAEDEFAAAIDLAGSEQVGDDAVEADLSEADDYAHVGQSCNFLVEPGGAGGDFFGEGLIAGRSAAHDRGDPRAGEPHAVIAMGGDGLRGKSGAMQQRIEEVSRAVAGEGAAGAVGAVRARSEADEENA